MIISKPLDEATCSEQEDEVRSADSAVTCCSEVTESADRKLLRVEVRTSVERSKPELSKLFLPCPLELCESIVLLERMEGMHKRTVLDPNRKEKHRLSALEDPVSN